MWRDVEAPRLSSEDRAAIAAEEAADDVDYAAANLSALIAQQDRP
jgi:hypothetical protein